MSGPTTKPTAVENTSIPALWPLSVARTPYLTGHLQIVTAFPGVGTLSNLQIGSDVKENTFSLKLDTLARKTQNTGILNFETSFLWYSGSFRPSSDTVTWRGDEIQFL